MAVPLRALGITVSAIVVATAGFVTGSAHATNTAGPVLVTATVKPSPADFSDITIADTVFGAKRDTAAQTVPEHVITAHITPDDDKVYGVAELIKIKFSENIPDDGKSQTAHAFVVVGQDKTVPPGEWAFVSDDTMVWRTENFLPAHTTLAVGHMPLTDGFVYENSSGKYKVAEEPVVTVKIGREMLTSVDADSHVATVRIDGDTVRTMGVSTGQPGYETRSGTKVTGEKYDTIRMTSASVNISDFYDLDVPYAVRLTDSGEFMHSAPWNPNIGSANTSRGCTNLTLDDGAWFYREAVEGDPVVTTGTSRQMGTADTNGGAWNYTWEQWKTKTA